MIALLARCAVQTQVRPPYGRRHPFRHGIIQGCSPMLVLTRKEGERIQIGDKICVTVVRIVGGGVRLGVEAPPEVPVLRAELKEAIDRERQSSSPPPQ
jgi:carbon storage regulator